MFIYFIYFKKIMPRLFFLNDVFNTVGRASVISFRFLDLNETIISEVIAISLTFGVVWLVLPYIVLFSTVKMGFKPATDVDQPSTFLTGPEGLHLDNFELLVGGCRIVVSLTTLLKKTWLRGISTKLFLIVNIIFLV